MSVEMIHAIGEYITPEQDEILHLRSLNAALENENAFLKTALAQKEKKLFDILLILMEKS